jgi:glycogen operon protein
VSVEILALREQQKRNFFATLLLSQGLPMLLAGDELGHTQFGNNNAYCQDNEISWLDWTPLRGDAAETVEFVRGLIALRRAHPVFRRPRFFRGEAPPGWSLKDIAWFVPEGREMNEGDWSDDGRRCFGALLSGETGDRFMSLQGFPEADDSFFLVLNAHGHDVEFTLPRATNIREWSLLIDTALPAFPARELRREPDGTFAMAAHSLALFQGVEG